MTETYSEPHHYGDTLTITCTHGYKTPQGFKAFDMTCGADSEWQDVVQCCRKLFFLNSFIHSPITIITSVEDFLTMNAEETRERFC